MVWGKRQVALRLIPKLQGCSDNLPARSGINLFVLFLRHLFQSIYLTVFGFDSRTVDDNERVTRFYPIPLLYEERIYTPGSFPLMRISVASTCPCSTIGCRLISDIPITDTPTVTINTTMNAMLMVLLLIFI